MSPTVLASLSKINLDVYFQTSEGSAMYGNPKNLDRSNKGQSTRSNSRAQYKTLINVMHALQMKIWGVSTKLFSVIGSIGVVVRAFGLYWGGIRFESLYSPLLGLEQVLLP